MLICDNLNRQSFDVNFISPEGAIKHDISSTTKLSTTSLATARNLIKLIKREYEFYTFDDVICTASEEHIPISIISYWDSLSNKPQFVMFKTNDPMKHEFIQNIKLNLKETHKNGNYSTTRRQFITKLNTETNRKNGSLLSEYSERLSW